MSTRGGVGADCSAQHVYMHRCCATCVHAPVVQSESECESGDDVQHCIAGASKTHSGVGTKCARRGGGVSAQHWRRVLLFWPCFACFGLLWLDMISICRLGWMCHSGCKPDNLVKWCRLHMVGLYVVHQARAAGRAGRLCSLAAQL